MKTVYLVPRDKVAKLARCPEGVSVREIDGMHGGTYRWHARRRCTWRVRCEVRKTEGFRAHLHFYFVR